METCNKEMEWRTFEDIRGRSSNIDITMATRNVIDKIHDWEIVEELVADHRMIVMMYDDMRRVRDGDGGANNMRPKTYNLRKARWGVLHRELRMMNESLMNTNMEGKNATDYVKIMQMAIIKACDRAIPLSTGKEKMVEWWTEEIGRRRSETRKRRRIWQRTGLEEDRRMYNRERNKYIEEIRKEKMKLWEKMVEEGEEDPWGRMYKLIMKKEKVAIKLTSLKTEDGEYTKDVRETMEYMLEKLIPADDEEMDTEGQRELRRRYEEDGDGMDEEEFRMEELKAAVMKIKNKKAPGIDGIKGEIIKRQYETIKESMLRAMNLMMAQGIFPDDWKEGNLKVFLKGEGKDPAEVRSYRPVTLLPVLGKVAERLIVNRLGRRLREEGKLSLDQYGYREGVGTIDVLRRLRAEVEETEEKFALGVFMDITGAFDGAWWPGILEQLRKWNCSRSLIRIIRDYFTGRKLSFSQVNTKVEKVLERGCPQGSVLGPLLWAVLFDGLLKLDLGERVNILAYADDALVMIRGNSRREVESKTKIAMERIMVWLRESKLVLSEQKTVAVLLKGKMVRRPVIEVEGRRIKTDRKTRYLGVEIEEGMKFGEHITRTRQKVLNLMGMIRRYLKAEKGLPDSQMMTIYKGVFEPIMLYGCELWGVDMNRRYVNKIRSMQRSMILRAIKGYSTVSHEAVRVVAGIMPIDLTIKIRIAVRKIKEERGDVEKAKREWREVALEEWQQRWERTMKGRETFKYFPDVRDREKMKISLNHYMVQSVTGHGNYKEKLMTFRLSETDRCRCGERENAWHVIKDCVRYREERQDLVRKLQERSLSFERENLVKDEDVRKCFKDMVTRIGRRKEKEDYEEGR
ncbi:hypothetical protein J6590_108203 [Homalodisca vitripennis]|nr:hypothetical protein J6590_108203 [Homalodisca vitripennis]